MDVINKRTQNMDGEVVLNGAVIRPTCFCEPVIDFPKRSHLEIKLQQW